MALEAPSTRRAPWPRPCSSSTSAIARPPPRPRCAARRRPRQRHRKRKDSSETSALRALVRRLSAALLCVLDADSRRRENRRSLATTRPRSKMTTKSCTTIRTTTRTMTPLPLPLPSPPPLSLLSTKGTTTHRRCRNGRLLALSLCALAGGAPPSRRRCWRGGGTEGD